MYRPHYITIKKEDFDKADAIVRKHCDLGDIDDYSVYEEVRWNSIVVVFKIRMYVSDDLEVIENEFRESGIELF